MTSNVVSKKEASLRKSLKFTVLFSKPDEKSLAALPPRASKNLENLNIEIFEIETGDFPKFRYFDIT